MSNHIGNCLSLPVWKSKFYGVFLLDGVAMTG